MKLFVAFIAFVAVAAVVPFKPAGTIQQELEAIIAAIQHPSTDPATAALLEQQLHEAIAGIHPPVLPEPVLVDDSIFAPVAQPDQPIASPIIIPSPIVVPTPTPTPSSSPLVQIIVNVKDAADVSPAPIVPTPILIAEEAFDNNPIDPTPVQIVDSPIVPAEPILIADPIVPLPAINLPGVEH